VFLEDSRIRVIAQSNLRVIAQSNLRGCMLRPMGKWPLACRPSELGQPSDSRMSVEASVEAQDAANRMLFHDRQM
jgi:hypothetical protein